MNEVDMEFLDIYNAERIKTGRTLMRGMPFGKDEYQLVVHVCIFNSKGEMLIQQRQSFKKSWPDKWNITAGGCVIAGENSREAAVRETKEELGIDLDLTGVLPRCTIYFEQGFDDIYVVNMEIDLADIKMQYEEVQNVCWASKEKIMRMLKEGTMVPFYPGFLEYLFDAQKQYGFLNGQEEV